MTQPTNFKLTHISVKYARKAQGICNLYFFQFVNISAAATNINVTGEDKENEKFHSLRSSLTLLADPQAEEPADETLAESIIDSMHTCVDTLASDEDPAPNQSHENTLNVPGMDSDDENDEYMAEMLPHDNTVQQKESTPNA